MDIIAEIMWACDRLMLCKAAGDVCELHEIGFWERATSYYEGKIELLQAYL